MKRLILLLVFPLLLSACGTSKTDDNIDTVGTVENIFTADETAVADETSETQYEIVEGVAIGSGGHGFRSDYYTDGFGKIYDYTGGEMSLDYGMKLSDMSDEGLGIELFLDGQPQPYRVEGGDGDGNEDYAYIHTFYPEDDVECTYTFLFIPVTGVEGDMLDLWAASVWNPTYFWDEEFNILYQTGKGTTVSSARLNFKESPDASPTIADASDLLLAWNIEKDDVTDEEISGWSDNDMLEKVETNFYANGSDEHAIYGVTSEDTITMTFEIWGNPNAEYCLVLFVDHKPVLIDGKSIDFELSFAQKITVTVELDISYFDGESIIYADLVPCNFSELKIAEIDGYVYFEGLGTFYLTSAEDYIELFGWEETAAE